MENKIGQFSLGSIKAFRGHEGETCLQGTILLGNKKVGEWSEDSWGGPHQFHFADREIKKQFIDEASKHPIAVEFEKEMREKHGVSKCQSTHEDLVVSTIAQELDLEKRQAAQMKRWCNTSIVIKEAGSADGTYLRYKLRNRRYDPKLDDPVMLKKHPGCEIVNSRYL